MSLPLSDGFLLVDKPAGLSSHDVVAVVRRARGRVRAGHTGTLDPFATGLLVVALGSATRLIRFLPSEPKVYRALVAFGTATDSDDSTGTVTGQGPLPDESAVKEAIARLTGTIDQVPPAYSARHVDGRRAYAIARAGGEPDLAPTTVTVHSWDIVSFTGSALDAVVTCSGGTYVRALARDLGRMCGTSAHLAGLRRTSSGPFDVSDAVPPDEASGAPLLSPAEALIGMPRQVVSRDDAARIHHGRPVEAREAGTQVALLTESG
ncbi:partial tRNA pseudouridine synthase B, partial [Gammaproteobacteria bacterium]